MKRIFVIILFLASFSHSAAQNSGTGIGLIFGEPSGISVKSWLSSKTAIDGAIGWSFANGNSFQIHADYLIHNNIIDVASGRLPLYYGIGGRFKARSAENTGDVRLGIRVPAGITMILPGMPVDIFLEIAPVMDVTPKFDLAINGAIGVRYFFK